MRVFERANRPSRQCVGIGFEDAPPWLCYACCTMRPVLLIATVLLTFGLLAAVAIAAAIKVVCFAGRASVYEALLQGAACGVFFATAIFVVVGAAGVDLDGRLFGDALRNGAAWVSLGALVGTSAASVRARRSTALRRP